MTADQIILIVEDNALVAKFYRMALERAGGYACHISENVAEILQRTRAGEIALAIVDVSLTGTEWEGRILDGVELTRMIKAAAPGRLPVLLATAHAMTGDRERLMENSGADDYLQKPVYEAEALVERVRALLTGQALR
jgi:CheY-like chemotaxis protein